VDDLDAWIAAGLFGRATGLGHKIGEGRGFLQAQVALMRNQTENGDVAGASVDENNVVALEAHVRQRAAFIEQGRELDGDHGVAAAVNRALLGDAVGPGPRFGLAADAASAGANPAAGDGFEQGGCLVEGEDTGVLDGSHQNDLVGGVLVDADGDGDVGIVGAEGVLEGPRGVFTGEAGDLDGADDGQCDLAVGSDDVFAGKLRSAERVDRNLIAAAEFVGRVRRWLKGANSGGGTGL